MALVISIIAMVTSIYEANIMKSQQTAMVWPYLKVTQFYNKDYFGFRIANKGTGPAIIKSVQVDFKGQPIADLDQLLDSLSPNRTFGYDILRNNSLKNQVFSANEILEFLALPRNHEIYQKETEKVLENIQHLRMRVLYESVLGDSWVFDSKDFSYEINSSFKAEVEFIN